MKGFAIFTNVLIPGVGSFVLGKVGQGIGQLVIWGVGLLLTLGTLGVGGVIGLPMMLGAWIWGIVTAAGGNQPVHVTVVNKDG